MKRCLLPFICILIIITTNAQKINPEYDSLLAKSLGADERGMKMYVLAILKTGEKSVTDKTIRDSLFKGHMANITRLADEGKLIVAGPLEKNDKSYRGIFIFNCNTIKEAEELVKTDPAVSGGIFSFELFEWYGSAALPVYIDTHQKINKFAPESSKNKVMKDTTPKVTGIGGVFFRCKDPEAVKQWYGKNLGLAINEYGSVFEFRNANRPQEVNYLSWGPFNEKTKYFDPSTREFMINYRVTDLEKLVENLRKNGVTIVDEIETYDYGKFVHIMDPEGTKIELWEPVDHVLTKLGGETTK